MAISPWVVGQTHPTWRITWTDDSKNPVDLTGATVTLWILAQDGAQTAGAGTPAVQAPATAGIVNYTPAAADVAKAGKFFVALKAVYPDGTILWQQPAIPWIITSLP